MRRTFVYDPDKKKMVDITEYRQEREITLPLFTGKAIDPTCVDAAIPRALKQLGDMDQYRGMNKRQLANAMGFNSIETVKRTWNPLL